MDRNRNRDGSIPQVSLSEIFHLIIDYLLPFWLRGPAYGVSDAEAYVMHTALESWLEYLIRQGHYALIIARGLCIMRGLSAIETEDIEMAFRIIEQGIDRNIFGSGGLSVPRLNLSERVLPWRSPPRQSTRDTLNSSQSRQRRSLSRSFRRSNTRTRSRSRSPARG